MRFSKKVSANILIVLGFISMILRYPNINAEHSADGMGVHWVASMIHKNGYNPLIIDPLSYFGMYPFSSPFGIQTLLTAIHQTTGIEITIIVLLIGHVFGLYGVAMVFMLGKSFQTNNQFAITTVLLYSTSYYFLDYTFWQISSRGPFMAMFITILFLLFRWENTRVVKYLLLMVVMYVVLMAIHRMVAFIILVVIVPYISMKIYYFVNEKYDIYSQFSWRKNNLLMMALVAIPFFISVYYPELLSFSGLELEKLWIQERYHFPLLSDILNIAFTYTSTNILIIFSFVGLMLLLTKRGRQYKETFLLIMLMFQGIFIVNYEYFMPIFLSTLSLLGGYGIVAFINNIEKLPTGNAIIGLIIIMIVAVPYTIYVRELNTNLSAEKSNPSGVEGFGIPLETRNAAMWIGNYIPNTARTIDNHPKSYQLMTMVDIRIMEDVDLVMTHRDGELKDVIVVKRYLAFEIFFNQRGYHYGGDVEDWYGPSDRINSGNHIYKIHANGKNYHLVEAYEIKYLIEYIENLAKYREWDSKLLVEAKELNYVIYVNELWHINFFSNKY